MRRFLLCIALLLLFSACLNSKISPAKGMKVEADMTVDEFIQVNNLKKEEAKVEKSDNDEITSWDLDNDKQIDVSIMIQPKESFNQIRIYDYEEKTMLVALVGRSSMKVLFIETYRAS